MIVSLPKGSNSESQDIPNLLTILLFNSHADDIQAYKIYRSSKIDN